MTGDQHNNVVNSRQHRPAPIPLHPKPTMDYHSNRHLRSEAGHFNTPFLKPEANVGMQRLLVILERDVGMFSLFQQVLNTLALIDAEKIERLPIALFGRGCIYYRDEGFGGKRSVWEYYFEPLDDRIGEDSILNPFGEDAFDVVESLRKDHELRRGAREFPQDLHLLQPLNTQDLENLDFVKSLQAFRDCIWTEDFAPIFEGQQATVSMTREVGSRLVKKYIRFRPRVQQKIDRFHRKHLDGHFVIGVHVRGTDGHFAPARGVDINLETYFSAIDDILRKKTRRACRILVASDEEFYVSLFKQKYGDIVASYDAVRKVEGQDIFGLGPTGQAMPAYLTEGRDTAVQNGEDVVVEYGLLCKSDVFVFNGSSIADAVTYSVTQSLIMR